mgnify:CR=1 FL=1
MHCDAAHQGSAPGQAQPQDSPQVNPGVPRYPPEVLGILRESRVMCGWVWVWARVCEGGYAGVYARMYY